MIFGALGLRRGKAEHKIMSWIGLVCAITLVICFAYAVAFFAAISESSSNLGRREPPKMRLRLPTMEHARGLAAPPAVIVPVR